MTALALFASTYALVFFLGLQSLNSTGGWYDVVAALRGVIDFHQLAAERYGIPAGTAALVKFANKLQLDSPIFEADIAAVRANIESCKRQAMQLRVSQATDLLQTVQVSAELDRIGRKAA